MKVFKIISCQRHFIHLYTLRVQQSVLHIHANCLFIFEYITKFNLLMSAFVLIERNAFKLAGYALLNKTE